MFSSTWGCFEDYDTSIAAVPLTELVPVSIVYGLTLILGALGNALVMMSYRFHRLQSVTNVFLVSLATANLYLLSSSSL